MSAFVDPDAATSGFVDPDKSPSGGIGRQIGLAAREVGPMAAGAAAGAALGAPIGGVGAVPGAVAGMGAMALVKMIDALGGTHYVDKALDALGLPRPETKGERLVADVTGSLEGVAGGIGVGKALQGAVSPIAQGVGQSLTAAPMAQAAAGATSGLASGGAREAGAGPVGQMAAGMAGGLAPFTGQLAAEGIRRGLRGSNPAEMRGAINAFESQGVGTPTVGQAANTTLSQGIEGTLPKIPGGAEPLVNKAIGQAENMGERVNFLANGLMKDATPMVAGRRIETGINKFVETFRDRQNGLYNVLGNWIKPETPTDISNFRTTLAKVTDDVPGLEEVGKILQGSKIQQMQQATESALKGKPTGLLDAQGKPMMTPDATEVPWQSVKKIRSLIGEKLSSTDLTSDISKQQLKQLYGSLSEDMKGAAEQAGPDAINAFNRANWFTQAGHARIDDALNSIAGRSNVENIFQAATGEAKNGGSTVTALMRSLEPDERKMVTAAFTKRLGWAGADQDAAGNYFSVAKFLTDWKKIDPMAKQAIYGNHVGTMASDLNLISAIGDRITRASKVGANPSGTAQGVLNAGGLITAASAAITGHLGTAALILGGMKTAQLSSRMMTNPDFVHWLAKSTVASPAMLPAQLNALADVAKHAKDSGIRNDIVQYQQQLQGALQ